MLAGLGPEGVDTLVIEDKKYESVVEKFFPQEPSGRGGLKDYNKGGTAAVSGYDFTIGTSHVRHLMSTHSLSRYASYA